MPANVYKEHPSTRSKIKMLDLFAALGFRWDREKIPHVMPMHSLERVTFHFHRMMTTYVWDASVLEGTHLLFLKSKLCLKE